MIAITVENRAFDKQVDDLVRQQLPYIMSRTLNETAKACQAAGQKEMQRVFNKPTRYTLNSIFVSNSNKRNLVAIVGLKDRTSSGRPASSYLQYQIFGGPRRHKAVEKAVKIRSWRLNAPPYMVPGPSAKLDQSGNITRSTYGKILAELQGEQQEVKKGKRRPATYWFGRRKGQKEPFGIMYRQDKKVGVYLTFGDQPKYSKRLPLLDVFKRTFAKDINKVYIQEFNKAMLSARK